MSYTESYTEYGVFIWHGSSQVLYRTFKQAQTVGIWRRTIADDEAAKIASVMTRTVSIQRGEWTDATLSTSGEVKT